MKNASNKIATSSEGFLLLNSLLTPIFINQAATEILCYPQKIESHKHLEAYLAKLVRTNLVSGESMRIPKLVSEFHSGRRLYHCRTYRVNSFAHGESPCSLAVILERNSSKSFSLDQVSEKYSLTGREKEVLQYLLNGLTSKQIASGMEISPNTVKAFLRMIMLKMGVSTRSGVVGKAFMGKP